MSLASFGVRKPVAAGLLMWTIIAAGVIFGLGLRREFFPEIRPNQVLVVAPYPGASPEEIESSLARKIEDRLVDLRDVKEIESTVTEGVATIRVEFEDGVDIDGAAADVKREVDALQDLPEQAERILVSEFEPNLPAISLALVGEADERVMKEAIREIRDDLRSLPGMGDVVLGAVRGDELVVDVNPSALLEHGISLPEVADRVRASMIELPGGAVKSSTITTPVRVMATEERAERVRSVVVRSSPQGRPVTLGEIAEVRDGFVDADVFDRLNGRPTASLWVYKVGEQDAVQMAAMVKAYAAGRRGEPLELTFKERVARAMSSVPGPREQAHELGRSKPAPPPGEIVLTSDLARFIVGRLGTLTEDGLSGAVLVFITLVIVLNWRAAWWVTTGLACSIFGTLAAMYFLDISLNLISMFGLIIVLGLLADDAIVISENILARLEAGEPALAAAENGTNDVYWPVITTVGTMIFAFAPLLLIKGQVGDFMSVLPTIVAAALVVSLVEALIILPAHMAHTLQRLEDERSGKVKPSKLRALEKKFDAARDAFFNRLLIPRYLAVLRRCVDRPWLTLSGAASIVIVSLGLVAGGRLPFVFFDSSDSETVMGALRMPVGTPVDQTDAIVRRIESAALAQPEVKSVYAAVGWSANSEGGDELVQSHLATVILEFTPVEERDKPSDQIIAAVRRELGDLPGVKSLRLEAVEGGPGGPPISLAVTGPDTASIMPAVETLQHRLAEFDGVESIASDADAGQREVQITLRPGATELGFTTEGLARQVRAAIHGIEAHTFPGDREDIDVRVRLAEPTRRSLAAIERLDVFTPDGRAVPLREAASITEAPGYATVRRIDGRRAITVTAEVDRAIANPEQVVSELRPLLAELEAGTPGLRVLERGRQKELAESFSSLPVGVLAAFALIYTSLAWLFSSYVQPLVVMTAIPFAAVGMIGGHLLMGYPLTFLSLIGFIALTGIVVNDSLIFIEFYNQRRRNGLGVREAAIDTGRARLRAILLTTTTTVPGLAPIMLSQSFQARFLIPMGITICFGLIASTVLILIALPALLMAWDQAQRAVRSAWTGRWESRPEGASEARPGL